MLETPIRRRIRTALILSLLLSLVAVPAAAQEDQPQVLEARPVEAGTENPYPAVGLLSTRGADYRIGRQDLLEIRVFNLPELDQTVRVADDGSITMPLLGRMQIAGLTKTELQIHIARLLGESYVRDPQVTVFIKEYESRKVAVSGAVKKPGSYEM
ncbi:MAG: polysaccharide biosynthesis/export family protein, partial [Acidobacteria bacterium]|nr:polysaccharide biosynthesis/export family protein [Candidatus Polarisedimenticola svalbardensis]